MRPVVTVVDYGRSNLLSVRRALEHCGADVRFAAEPGDILRAGALVLPGVGAFGDAAALLRRGGLDQVILEEASRGKPLLGICLGMQLLLERSFEYGEHPGLGLIPGDVVPLAPALPPGYKVPHIGWNALRFPVDRPVSPLFRHIHEGDYVYFVHSFYGANCAASTIATAEYGAVLTAAVARNNVFGVQFHPEKSGAVGLSILRAFCELL